MPAPTRQVVPVRPIAQTSVMAVDEEQKPLVITPPGVSQSGDFLSRFTEVLMFGGALIGIWTGLLGIAFSDDATNYNYLVLFVGGFISAGIALAMVEFHGKKNEYLLMPSQNYLLGMSFFFMAVGLLWGVRFLSGWLTYDSPFDNFDLFGPRIADESSWIPDATIIYFQALGAGVLVLVQQRILSRYKGELTFSWTITCIVPLALLLVGIGPWIDYSGNVVSYEIGSAIVCLTAIAMISAVNSNKSITFTIIAAVCGLIPFIYEIANSNADKDGIGGALSLLVFIIIIQGYLATNSKLNQKLMEKTSFILIGEIVIAMLVANAIDANAILGPIKFADTAFAETLTLPVVFWFVTLAAFFPAVLNNRVPAMPIGLAFALWTLNGDEAILPWVTALIMIFYMLFFAKATRKWVANLTISALAISYLLADRIGYGIETESINLAIAFAIIAMSWVALKLEKISFSNGIQAVVFILLSSTIMESEYWFTSWIIVLFLVSIVYDKLKSVDANDFIERRNATLGLITSLSFAAGMMLNGKMDIPYEVDALSGANIEFVLFGLIVHFVFFQTRKMEMDLGEFLWVIEDKSDSKWTFDSNINAWVMKEDGENELSIDDKQIRWGELSRFSLAFSIFSVCLGLSGINIENPSYQFLLPLLMALPISLLMHQLFELKEISSQTRFVGVLHLIIVAAFTRPLIESITETATQKDSLIAGIIHDLILLSAPLYVNYVISKKGLDEHALNRFADNLMFAGLVILSVFDQSGGLMFFSLFMLVALQSMKYRMGVINCIPFVFILTQGLDTFSPEYGLAYQLMDMLTTSPESYFDTGSSDVLWFTKFTGIITCTFMACVLGMSIYDSKNDELDYKLSWFVPLVWFFFAALAALPNAAWLPLFIVIFGITNAWYRGELRYMQFFCFGLIMSWLLGFSEGFDEMSGEVFGNSMLFGGISVAILTILTSAKIMTKYVEDFGGLDEDEYIEKIHNDLKFFSLVPLMLSFNVYYGIGMLIASVWATVEVDKPTLLLMPLIHALTLGNQLSELNISDEEMRGFIVGLLLVAEGLGLLYISSRDDMVYDAKVFTWRDDDEFFLYVERMGLAGTLSAIAGVGYAFNSDLQLAFFFMTVILSGIAITGFNEKYQNVRWRRALGVYGSMISGLCLYNMIDNDLFAGLTIVGLSLLAMGFGFIYLQQRSSYAQQTPSFIQPALTQEQIVSSIPEPVTAESVEEGEDDREAELDDLDEELDDLDAELAELDEELDELDEEYDDDEENLQPLPEKKIEKIVQKEVESSTISTVSGLEIRFPPGVLENITKTIQLTPHDGFNPVLELGENGKLRLVFDPSQ